MKASSICNLIIVSAALIFGCKAYPKEMVLSTNVGLALFHDDQFDLRRENTEVTSFVYQPEMSLSYNGRVYESELFANAVYNRYIDSFLGDTENATLGWTGRRRGLDSTLALNANYSERIANDLVGLGGSLEVAAGETVKILTISPSYTRALSARNRIDLIYGYQQTRRFEDDNDRHSINTAFLRSITPRSNVGLYLDFLSYRSKENQEINTESDADVYSLSFGGEFTLSERWMLNGSIGGSQAVFDDLTISGATEELDRVVEDGDILLTARVVASYNGLRNDFGLRFYAGTEQQFDGTIDNQQTLELLLSREINRLLSFNTQARFFQAELDSRENYLVSAALDWTTSQKWRYQLSYRYQTQTSIDDENPMAEELSGDSNRIVFTVFYKFDNMQFEF